MKYINNRDDKIIQKYKDLHTFLSKINPIIVQYEEENNHEMANALKFLAGLLPNQAVRKVVIPEIGEIDKGIADIILRLHEHHYETIASCSGLEEDHNDKASLGYISFLDNIKNRTFIEELSQNYNFMAELGYTYFRETITIRFERDGLLYIMSFTKNHF